jgi:hypothetical protein
MTANADTGATRADTTGNGTTGDNFGNDSATSHSVSRAGIDTDDRSWTPPTNTDVRHDRVRWGAVWTGVLTTLSIYIVLQLLFFALARSQDRWPGGTPPPTTPPGPWAATRRARPPTTR